MSHTTRTARKVSPGQITKRAAASKPPSPALPRKAPTAPRNPAEGARAAAPSKRSSGPTADGLGKAPALAGPALAGPASTATSSPAPADLWGYVAAQLLALAALVAGYEGRVSGVATAHHVLDTLAKLLTRWAARGGSEKLLGIEVSGEDSDTPELLVWLGETPGARSTYDRLEPLSPADPWGDVTCSLSALAERCRASDARHPGAGHVGGIVAQDRKSVV